MLGASATIRIPTKPPAHPIAIQGRRIPSHDEVRSLNVPKNRLPNMATTAPLPAIRARLLNARSSPTSEFTFNARVTRAGARNSKHVLMYADVKSAMNGHPSDASEWTVAPARLRGRVPKPRRPLKYSRTLLLRLRMFRADVHSLAGASEDAEDLGGFVAGAAEPVRDLGVELRDLARPEHPVLIAEQQT